MRLFIALGIPDDIKKLIGRLRVDIPGARWVPTEQIHLTLAFLGEMEEAAVEPLNRELARIHLPEFTLCFSGTGCFPDRRRPRVLWVGVEPHPHLKTLAARVHEVVVACGIPQEERPFSPHITLARFKFPASRESDAFFVSPETLSLPAFQVREFILFQSRLMPHGAVHIPLRNFPLATDGSGGAH